MAGASKKGDQRSLALERRRQIDVTVAASDTEHANRVVDALRDLQDVVVLKVSDRTFLAHLGGKLTVESKVPIRHRDDLSMIYTPGVARVVKAIAEKAKAALATLVASSNA